MGILAFLCCIVLGSSGADRPVPAANHTQVAPDTLRLTLLREAAARQDPRSVQPRLLAEATRLRLAALRAQRLPQLAITAQATVQNEVVEIPINLPGQDLPHPSHEQFRAQLEADWMLFDGGRTNRQTVAEQARLAEELAGVAVTLNALREATTEAFFGALLATAQAETFALAADDLAARLRVVRAQAEEGAALASDAAMLEAALIRVRQQVQEAQATRRAALGVLSQLTGLFIREIDVLVPPNLDAEVARALQRVDAEQSGSETAVVSQRPELLRIACQGERAEAEAQVRETQMRPSVSLFGQAGVGRPSPFNFFAQDVGEFGLAGVRLRWSLFDGNRVRHEAEALRMQAQLAEAEADAFVRQVVRGIEDERANLERLNVSLSEDERVVQLREEVLRVSCRQLDEGVLLPDTYTDRLTDLAEARLTLVRHRIERAQAQARLLSTLGRYPSETTDFLHFD